MAMVGEAEAQLVATAGLPALTSVCPQIAVRPLDCVAQMAGLEVSLRPDSQARGVMAGPPLRGAPLAGMADREARVVRQLVEMERPAVPGDRV